MFINFSRTLTLMDITQVVIFVCFVMFIKSGIELYRLIRRKKWQRKI